MSELPKAARLAPADVGRVGLSGLRSRPVRLVLSALGIAIGIAAMVSVLGISASSRAALDELLSRFGTNLLTVKPGQTLFGEPAVLPPESVAMIGRIGPVQTVSATGEVAVKVYRTDKVPAEQSGGIAVLAARTDLPAAVGATVATGNWLTTATAQYPAVILGATTARRLGIDQVTPETLVWLGDRWVNVIGILEPVPLAPELDTAALIGWPAAQQYFGFDGAPTTVYERSGEDSVDAVRDVLARTANPENPDQVEVSRPSDALAAQHATDETFTALLLGLGAVALLVGGVGVANTMIISVLERRGEIGLRRALGATRGHIRVQFLAESLLLSGLGGVAGLLLGAAITGGYAISQGWPIAVPLTGLAGGLGATLLIGAVAGLYPAVRASRLDPAQALSAP
ncbi:ABC transporter permease [Kribbella sp. HUAS MG21]|uniref:ABC transporter permease n=1 Tax=Kribbella sp. HUAS MG21 TaxID=3160966 RepID=A0AAU7T336_9ACTN